MNQNFQTTSMIPSNSISYGYYMPTNSRYNTSSNQNDERLAGGFVFPFLLGGVTGAALAPSFWGNNNRPPVYYYQPGPYYPYPPRPFPPRRWF